MSTSDAHLIVKAHATDAAFLEFCTRGAEISAARGGCVYIAARQHAITLLEPGTPAAHIWAARFADAPARDDAWQHLAAAGAETLLTADLPPVVLAASGLPRAGLDDPAIPTAANVTPPVTGHPPAFMLIEGSVSDPVRIDSYRAVILPMITALKGFYIVFEPKPPLAVLSGRFDDQVFIISQWPDIAAAQAFWLSDRYQRVAIPRRIGAGRFGVRLVTGIADGRPQPPAAMP